MLLSLKQKGERRDECDDVELPKRAGQGRKISLRALTSAAEDGLSLSVL